MLSWPPKIDHSFSPSYEFNISYWDIFPQEPPAADKVEKKQLDEKGPEVVVPLAAASMKQAQETLSKTNKIGNLGEEQLYQPAFLPDSACDGNEKAVDCSPCAEVIIKKACVTSKEEEHMTKVRY